VLTHDPPSMDGKFDEVAADLDRDRGVLPRTHGSSVFTRGETQASSPARSVRGGADDAQKIESSKGRRGKELLLHYNFRPSRLARSGSLRGPGRPKSATRALAERALTPLMPAADQFPYTVRGRVRHPRVERILVDGVGLRRLARDDGRRRADEAGGSRASRWARDRRE